MRVTARLAAVLKRWLARYLFEDAALSLGVMLYALTQLASIGWDLPCMYGWENDGVAPRDLFGGLAFNLTPGNGHRYPLFHYLLLALFAWPVVLVAALRARSWRLPDLMQSVLSVPALTGIAIVAKLVAVVMGCVTVLALARIARRTCSVSAGRWAAAFATLNLSLSYYGRVSNVDGPYLMWVALSLDRLLDVFERGELRDYRGVAICAAAALATKDQAYGVYALSLPIYCVVLPMVSRALPIAKALHFRRLGSAAMVGGVSYGFLSGALLNPTGFVHRLHLLTGENSQDWRRYERSAAGVWANLNDVVHSQAEFFWSWPVVMLAWACVLALCLRSTGRGGLQARAARLLPLSFAVSSLLTFTLVAARCEHRFVLPLGLSLAYYAGIAAAVLCENLPRVLRYGLMLALLLPAASRSLTLHVTQWSDGRRQVEAWLARLPAGSRVETYGLGVYLPRFDRSSTAPYHVQRVAPAPAPSKRPPIPGMLEIQAAYGRVAERAPDVLVVTEGFATRFLPDANALGHITSPETAQIRQDQDAQTFFAAALSNQLPEYALAFVAETRLPHWAQQLGWEPIHIHGSTASTTWVLVREHGAVRH